MHRISYLEASHIPTRERVANSSNYPYPNSMHLAQTPNNPWDHSHPLPAPTTSTAPTTAMKQPPLLSRPKFWKSWRPRRGRGRWNDNRLILTSWGQNRGMEWKCKAFKEQWSIQRHTPSSTLTWSTNCSTRSKLALSILSSSSHLNLVITSESRDCLRIMSQWLWRMSESMKFTPCCRTNLSLLYSHLHRTTSHS